MFTIFKTPMLTELTGGDPAAIDWQGNIGLAAFLLGGAAGGLVLRRARRSVRPGPDHGGDDPGLFGVLRAHGVRPDRPGRSTLLRFLVALGTGGEWAIAAAWWPRRFPLDPAPAHRGSSMPRASWASRLASLTGMVFVEPGPGAGASSWAWRPRFWCSGSGSSIREPERWIAARRTAESGLRRRPSRSGARTPREAGASRSSSAGRRGDPVRFLGLGLATVGLATYWGIFAWSPELVGSILGDGRPQAGRQSGWRAWPTCS